LVEEGHVPVEYDIIVNGHSARLRSGFLGLANLTLIQTGDGPILFDVGHMPNRDALVAGLARHGLRPDQVTVFLSHCHFDHAGSIDVFPTGTRVYLGRKEWDYAARPHEKDVYVPWMIREQLQRYDLVLLDGEGEICDGVSYVEAPGHTPGCTALVLDTKDKGCVVLAADALKTPKEALSRRSDMSFLSDEDSTRTIEKLLSIADRIVPGHYAELILRDGVWVWEDPMPLELIFR
jgi:glyoxylase-like metal-dependent hydrolase (beta-lactamase superfamily II)